MTVSDVSSIYSTIASADTAAATNTSLSDAANTVGGDFDTFLQMLTTQMQNQDPLNPDDPTDFATQLAQFSAVEQSVLTNDLLEQVLGALTVSDTTVSQMSQWIGNDALVQTDAYYSGEQISMRPLISTTADSAKFVVTDADGNEVLRTSLPIDEGEVMWGGGDTLGNEVAHGYYTLSVESYSGDELIGTEPGLVYSHVSEARIADNGIVLRLEDGSEINASDAYGMREPV